MKQPNGTKKRGRPRKKKGETDNSIRLPKGTVLISSNAREWHEPTKKIKPIRYCKLDNGKYVRLHQNKHSTGRTPVTAAHIKHMAEIKMFG